MVGILADIAQGLSADLPSPISGRLLLGGGLLSGQPIPMLLHRCRGWYAPLVCLWVGNGLLWDSEGKSKAISMIGKEVID